MKIHVCIALLMCASPAVAAEQPAATMTVFLRSMTTLYITSEQCKHQNNLNAENYSGIIRDYLTAFYGPDVPYWALPIVEEKIKSRQQCVDSLSENIAAYEVYSTKFADAYPNQPVPPPLPELSSGQVYTAQYRVTAPVITK